ncbi:hypothetical protein DICSQDRAFT_149368 [Dichomitus squalens LYAD-421 SS1]|uniref:Protein kinase domain-containing protein n=1 Tax=Dichomitus squalens (strain LYAD-421) TaxID=732165 RepID=R7SSW6_DICSQ|nr:uncharacterized protein DICSQDRAFT_149368 [Dichomitus squalens LYAD-421 SS1]EJF58077.1 hypothetical protein DICSQDRAFT_149368 [Dichomitus squalens LYAD-421 SS1]
MADNLSEIELEKMFEEFIPGEDPCADYLTHCDFDPHVADVEKESDLNPKICVMAHSAIAHARVCPTLVVRDISCWQVSGQDRKSTQKGTRSDCAVYLDNERTRKIVDMDRDDFMKTSRMSEEDKNARKDWVGRRAWGDMVAFVEAKHKHEGSAFEFNNPGTRFTRDDTDGGRKALGQFAEYVANILAHQHRTHVYALYVYRDQARICFFDRSGGIVSTPFHYGTTDDTTFQRFFYRLAGMSREQLGFDPTAVLADESVVDDLRAWAAAVPTEYLRKLACEALCWDPATNSSSSAEWPTHEVTFKGKTLYVGKPAFSNLSLFGRCTRGYVAIEKETGEDGSVTYSIRYLKDSWRNDHPNVHPEHEVYERLRSRGVVEYIPTCLGGEDVLGVAGAWQQTRTGELLPSKPLQRGHYRILLKEVCRPLSDFKDYRDLAMILGHALSAHQDSWEKADVLHRDVSYNNILIYETKNDNGDIIRKGLLADWDLSKYKEYMIPGFGPRQPDRTGTWYFRSAVSQRYPRKPYAVSDDIESFVHVYHYCVLRFHETAQSKTLMDTIRSTYEYVERRAEDGAYVGGFVKFEQMRIPHSVISPRNNETLRTLLELLAGICATHYATIDAEEFDRLYTPVPEGTGPAMSTTRGDPADGDSDVVHVPEIFIGAQHRITPQPRPTLQDHSELLNFFREWGTIQWRDRDCVRSSEDLFKNVGLAPSKDNAFGSSQSESSQSRAVKRRKHNTGTPLTSVSENVERLDES